MSTNLFNALADSPFWERTALAIRKIILTRTKAGKDVNGIAFKEYTKAYAKKRAKAGLPITPPDLIFDEHSGMMHDITHTVFNDYSGVEIYINSDAKEQLAVYHNIMGAGKSKIIREFWGLTDEEVTEIIGVGEQVLLDTIEKTIADTIIAKLKKLKFKSVETA